MAEPTTARRTRRGSGRRADSHVRNRRLVTTVWHGLLVRMAHLNVLLLHLVRKLEGALGPHVAHGRLQWVETTRPELLAGGDHAHIDVLLMGSLELLLLLLEQFDLLLDGKLVHCRKQVSVEKDNGGCRAALVGWIKCPGA